MLALWHAFLSGVVILKHSFEIYYIVILLYRFNPGVDLLPQPWSKGGGGGGVQEE